MDDLEIVVNYDNDSEKVNLTNNKCTGYTGCSILFRVLFSQFISATWNEYGHVTNIFKENLKGNSMQKKFAEKHNPY